LGREVAGRSSPCHDWAPIGIVSFYPEIFVTFAASFCEKDRLLFQIENFYGSFFLTRLRWDVLVIPHIAGIGVGLTDKIEKY